MAGYAGAQYFLSRYDYLARISQEAEKLFRSKTTLDAVTLVIPWSFSVGGCCYYRVFLAAPASSHFSNRALPCLCRPVVRLLASLVFRWARVPRVYDSLHTRIADRRCVVQMDAANEPQVKRREGDGIQISGDYQARALKS